MMKQVANYAYSCWLILMWSFRYGTLYGRLMNERDFRLTHFCQKYPGLIVFMLVTRPMPILQTIWEEFLNLVK